MMRRRPGCVCWTRGGGGRNLLVAKKRLWQRLQHIRTKLCSFNTYVMRFARPTMNIDKTACAVSFMFW